MKRTRLAVALLALLAPGCAEPGPQVVPVRGTVTRQGKPVPRLFLDFQPAEGRNSWAFTDEQGRYELEYDEGRKGAEVGEHTVTVSWRPPNLEAELALQSGQLRPHPEADRIVAQYGVGAGTRKKVSVAPGTEVIDLRLD
jgi:hypothetical protein